MREDAVIQIKKFCEIDLSDPFFDSLKDGYAEFPDWFARKAHESAFVSYDSPGRLQGFLYLKAENGPILDVNPPLGRPGDVFLKVGTFKIVAHGTKMGERFLKKVIDVCVSRGIQYAYLTVFLEHQGLIDLVSSYGFMQRAEKISRNGTEIVFLKDVLLRKGGLRLDYPLLGRGGENWIVSVYPEYHTGLFPDSRLQTERPDVVNDLDCTNSITKVYVGRMRDLPKVRPGDNLLIYRPKDKSDNGSTWYRSVATSVCVVDEIIKKSDFMGFDHFYDYCRIHSIFNENDLRKWFDKSGDDLHAVKMTYNVALPRRVNRKGLVEGAGIPRDIYWGLAQITPVQFENVLRMGEVNESIIVN